MSLSLCSLIAISVFSAAIAAAPLGSWSTAELSFARANLAATSVGDVAIFAGGEICAFLQVLGVQLVWLSRAEFLSAIAFR
jgi:hypothetical protein